MVEGASPELLRGEVRRRAEQRAGLGGVVVQQLGDAEVRQLHVAGGGEEHVGRLDVAVHDPDGVRGRERLRKLARHPQRLGHGERPAGQASASEPPGE